MRLFDSLSRNDQDPALYAEPHFDYLNRSARPEAQAIRRLLERWYSRFPEEGRHDLRKRLRSRKDSDHLAAFFELYLHELLRQLGYKVSVHPGTSTGKQPDFWVTCASGKGFYLEARVASNLSQQEQAAKNWVNALYDALNNMHSEQFFIGLDLQAWPKNPPSGKKIRKFIERRLAGLDFNQIVAAFQRDGFGSLPRWRYDDDGWVVHFFPLPKSSKQQARTGLRPLACWFEKPTWVDSSRALRKALQKKAGRYGELGAPYVVAVNAVGLIPDEIAVMEALLGKEVWVNDLGWSKQPRLQRMPQRRMVRKGWAALHTNECPAAFQEAVTLESRQCACLLIPPSLGKCKTAVRFSAGVPSSMAARRGSMDRR